MIHFKTFTIPANTPVNNPVRGEVVLDTSLLRKILIRIPPGVMGLAGIRIEDAGKPLVPYNPNGFITGAEEVVTLDFEEPLNSLSNKLDLWGYNTDDTYPHTFYLYFVLRDVSPTVTVTLRELTEVS